MADKRALTGEWLGPAKSVSHQGGGALTAGAGLNALTQLVNSAHECIVVMAQEKTNQTRLAAYRDTEVTKIKAAESILKKYFDDVFSERRRNIDGLFERLDRAIDTGDPTVISQMVTAVVDLAKKSPIADLGDLSQIRAALDDPAQVWEL